MVNQKRSSSASWNARFVRLVRVEDVAAAVRCVRIQRVVAHERTVAIVHRHTPFSSRRPEKQLKASRETRTIVHYHVQTSKIITISEKKARMVYYLNLLESTSRHGIDRIWDRCCGLTHSHAHKYACISTDSSLPHGVKTFNSNPKTQGCKEKVKNTPNGSSRVVERFSHYTKLPEKNGKIPH